jgi:exopolyphosphatase/guanosine-5'-triphosphate,3'-diphosphate pyrophosphatase
MNIGCVRMTERHFANASDKDAAIAAATSDIDAAIAEAAAIVPITQAKTLIAVAGTATTVAAGALELLEYDRYAIHLARISAERTHEISQYFLHNSRETLMTKGYMHPGRVDVIGAGSLVLDRIMKATALTEFVASESDILDGMAWSLV